MKKVKVIDYEKMAIVNPRAAGIDVGSKSHFVCINQTEGGVREFGCYTKDLQELCDWLMHNHITTVALESTGSYFKPLLVLLQANGLNPILVNGKYTKNVKGKKTDVMDCQWIQKLHSLGMLEGSFIPDLFTETLRQYCRHRSSLIVDASSYINKMQKALRMTNIRLDSALRDMVGPSGKAIIEAILKGERDPKTLAYLTNSRVKKSKEEITLALTGDWREEYLFELKQSYDLYQYIQQKIQECDQEIGKLLDQRIEDNEKQDGEARLLYGGIKTLKPTKNEIKIDVVKLSYQLSAGVDLSEIEGVGKGTILTFLSEVGTDMSSFATAKHFASWLHLAPNNKKTGGKIISKRTQAGKNKLADALRHAANAIGNKKDGSLNHFFKRIAMRKGRVAAITATARKLAVIIYNMLTKKRAYMPMDQTAYLDKIRKSQIRNLQHKINRLKIVPGEIDFSKT